MKVGQGAAALQDVHAIQKCYLHTPRPDRKAGPAYPEPTSEPENSDDRRRKQPYFSGNFRRTAEGRPEQAYFPGNFRKARFPRTGLFPVEFLESLVGANTHRHGT